MDAKSVVEATIEAKVIRANGDVEDLGVVSSYKRDDNVLKRLWRKVKAK